MTTWTKFDYHHDVQLIGQNVDCSTYRSLSDSNLRWWWRWPSGWNAPVNRPLVVRFADGTCKTLTLLATAAHPPQVQGRLGFNIFAHGTKVWVPLEAVEVALDHQVDESQPFVGCG